MENLNCKHFGTCGGCSLQDVPYPVQLQGKLSRFKELLAPLADGLQTDIAPSPSPWSYRNKMEFSFSQYREERRLGLKKKGQWRWVVNLEECPIFDPSAGALLDSMRGWMLQERLAPYHAGNHVGFLRYLAARKGLSASGSPLMALMLVTSSQGTLPAPSLLAALKQNLGENAFSLHHGIQDAVSDAVIPETVRPLAGDGHLYETILGRRLRYSLDNFFQPNPRAFEALLSDLLERAKNLNPAPKKILDLYCGVGTISLALAGQISAPVTGIESVPSAIEDAWFNLALHPSGSPSLPRCEFIVDKAETASKNFLTQPEIHDGLLVLDPPRSGLHPKMRQAVLDHPPRYLFYVSCNPALALREDLPRFSQSYKIDFTKAYDFFPHTGHFEALFILKRNG